MELQTFLIRARMYCAKHTVKCVLFSDSRSQPTNNQFVGLKTNLMADVLSTSSLLIWVLSALPVGFTQRRGVNAVCGYIQQVLKHTFNVFARKIMKNFDDRAEERKMGKSKWKEWFNPLK